MAKLRVHALSMSIDGYVAGPHQSAENGLGIGGENLHDWLFGTRTWLRTHGQEGGDETGVDEQFMRRAEQNAGATIMGRRMFGPITGPWPDPPWNGWWGDSPPFHHDVFVLTHHEREPLALSDTTFHFVTDGIEAALERAFASAGGKDVRVGGGAQTVQQYLDAGLIDEMHLAIAPMLLGSGERLLVGDITDKYECVEYLPSNAAAHVVMRKKA